MRDEDKVAVLAQWLGVPVDKFTPDVMRILIEYDPVTGRFRWGRHGRPSKRGFKPAMAGRDACVGLGRTYLGINILDEQFYAHRLAWWMTHGRWPEVIDHISGVTTQNNIENLRECTKQQNSCNRAVRRGNKTGVSGVRRSQNGKRFEALIGVRGEQIFLGSFDSLEEAAIARHAAELKYYKEFSPLAR
jgi:hypothetical protein